MKLIQSIIIFFLLSTIISGQSTDHQAVKLLKELTDKYEAFRSFEFDFEMKIEAEGHPEDIQKGMLIQRGSQYKLDLPEQMICSDGKLVWVYLKNQNEVQIDNADLEEENLSSFSPKQILKHFNSGDYEYGMLGKNSGNPKGMSAIEFKPLDKESDYIKMRLTIRKSNKEIQEIFLLEDDGTRYTISIKEMIPDKEYLDQVFIFDSSRYPGIYIEDLRIE